MRQAYTPREGSAPARVIAHLAEHGGSITAMAIAALLEIDRKNVAGNMATAVRHGLLIRDKCNFSLGDGTPPMKTLKQVSQEFHRKHQAVGDVWGGATKPAFPGAPPRAGDPAPAIVRAATVTERKTPAIRTAVETTEDTMPANLRQIGGTHYKQMAVQPWDVVDGWPLDQRIGFYRGNALKYLMRMGMGSKDQDAQEISKGRHYIEKLLEVLQEQDLQAVAA